MTTAINFFSDLMKFSCGRDGAFENAYSCIQVKVPKRVINNITVGYISNPKKSFISNIINVDNFLNLLSNFVKIVIIPIDSVRHNLREINRLNLDYLYADICCFHLWPFVLREKYRINLPFIVWLHTVYDWAQGITRIIPLIRKEDIIVAPSEYAKESFSRISRKITVHVIPYCLDVKNIQNNVAAVHKPGRKVITFMGRLKKEKGIEVLIKCMPKIIAKIGNVHLNIVGPLSADKITNSPKSPYVNYLQKEVRRSRLADNVHFKGVQLGLNKYRILSESDVFVNPTTAKEETFSVVNLEALACSVPVISTKWTGIKEMIREGKNGYLVNVGYDKRRDPRIDTKRLISLIVTLLKNKDLKDKMKIYSKKIALNYDYLKVMPQFIKLLKKRRSIIKKSRWNLIKNKRLIDFKDLYQKEMCFFIVALGWHNMSFCNDSRRMNYHADKRWRKNISDELWNYLSLSSDR